MYIYVLLLGIYFILFVFKKFKSIFLYQLFLMFAIPDNPLILQTLHLQGTLDINVVISIFMILALLIQKRKYNLKKHIFNLHAIYLSILVILIFLMSFIIGWYNRNLYLLTVTKDYIYYLIIVLASIWWIKRYKLELNVVANYLLITSAFFIAFTMFIYFIDPSLLTTIYTDLPDGREYIERNRIAFPNDTALLGVIMIVCIQWYRTKSSRIKIACSLYILMSSFSIIISQSRALIFSLFFLLILFAAIYIITEIYKMRKKTYLTLSVTSWLIPIISILIYIVINSHISIVNILISRIYENTNSLSYRIASNSYNFSLAKQNLLFGRGIGSILYYLNNNGVIYRSSAYSDNYFIHILNNFGLIGLVIITAFLIYMIIKCLHKVRNNVLYLYILTAFCLLILNGFYMTSQIIHSKSVLMIFSYFCYLILVGNSKHKYNASASTISTITSQNNYNFTLKKNIK